MDNLNFYIVEFERLKHEQLKRIEFRDHMIYLTLIAIGTVFAFCLEKPEFNFAFLVLPFFCIIMGWTYYVNDRKVSAISDYINNKLIPKIAAITDQPITDNWEIIRKNEPDRIFRKWFQLLIDVSLFCASSVISIVAYFILNDYFDWSHLVIVIIEGALILILLVLFIISSQK